MKTGVLALVLFGLFASPASATDYIVNSHNDRVDASPGDRICATATPMPDGTRECTLRAAIQEANQLRPRRRTDRIFLGVGDYRLSLRAAAGEDEDRNQLLSIWDTNRAAQVGDLDIDADVTIIGQGPTLTVIDGGDIDRVFDIWSLGLTHDITYQDLTIRNGFTSYQGGCVNNRGFHGTVTMSSVRVEQCVAHNSVGGGMFNNGVAFLYRVLFRNNLAVRGGGLENGYIAQIDESTFDSNGASPTPTERGAGGGISNIALFGDAPSLMVRNSTISFNGANEGGGIANHGSATIVNSTVTGNNAGVGGGIALLPAAHVRGAGHELLSIANSTIVNNRGSAGVTRSGTLALHLVQSILAGNQNFFGVTVNCDGGVTDSHHSLEDATTCGFAGTGDISSTDPLLGPLADNGGQTQTHALLTGSPAIDAASSVFDNRDQRGFPRPFGAAVDIGAYEKGFEFIVLIPLDWSALFRDIFTMSDTSFRVDLSLVTRGKRIPDVAKARIMGVKAANGPVKFESAKDGQSMTVSGVFTPPKDLSNSTLFYLEVLPGVRKRAWLQMENIACDCDAKPRKNPPPIKIPKYKAETK